MRTLRNWAVFVFIFSFLVIIAGAVVRTTQSGMGCPDWPRCFGKWIPPTDASQLPADFEKYLRKQDIDHSFNAWHTWIEYINRLFGALLGVFAIIQVVLAFSTRRISPRAYRLAVSFLAVVILTGLFGALVVKLNLAHTSVSVHLFFALLLIQIQLALLVAGGSSDKISVTYKQKRFFWLLLFLLIAQIILGTNVRIHIDDVSKSLGYGSRESWLYNAPILFFIHRSFSVLLLVAGLLNVFGLKSNLRLKNIGIGVFAVLVLAAAAGITLNYFHFPAFAQPLHLLLAALALTQTVYMILKTKTERTGQNISE